jgi:hypothetical protein
VLPLFLTTNTVFKEFSPSVGTTWKKYTTI